MPVIDVLTRLGVALAIGLLIGLERGWRTRDETDHSRAAGFRTFALTGLMGGVAGLLSTAGSGIVLGLFFLGFMAAFIAFSWLEARASGDLSATTVVAAALTFALGAYAVLGHMEIAAAGGVAAMALLALREPLHRWVASLRWEEIRAVLVLLAMTFLLLPVIPNRVVDPWGIINPYEIWLLAILIAAISFVGYVAVRVFGERIGVVMAGAAGGLASSTATTLTFARLARNHPDAARVLAGGIVVAGIVMTLRVGVVVLLLDRSLFLELAPPIAVAALVQGLGAAVLLLRSKGSESPKLGVTNPLDLSTTLKLTAFIVLVTVAVEAVRRFVGGGAILAVAALSGVADVDAVTISMTRLVSSIGTETAASAVLTAVGVNTIAKAAMATWVGGTRLGLLVAVVSLLALAAGAGAYFFLN